MNFWIFAIAMLAVAAIVISWPLFAGSAKDRITAVFILLILPLTSLLLYQNIGTPKAINLPAATPQQQSQQQAQQQDPHASQQGQMDDLVASLQQRMAANPDDPEGWLILGRSLKTMQRYAEAEEALSNANRLNPDNPMIMVELAETSLFASGQPQVSPESRQLLESALAIDPNMQKGLWLMGTAYAQDGNEAEAITYWQKLLDQLDPTSGAASSVSQQIEMAQTKMGETAAAPKTQPAATEPVVEEAAAVEAAVAQTTAPISEAGIPVNVSIDSELGAAMPGNAILFVFIHPNGARGMPLAVKRLAPQGFPMSLNFSDADLLNPEMSLESFEKLDISARVSMAGSVMKATGDYEANMVTVDTKAVTTIALHLDQRVP
jgi:cytochrome c-type biogenesis protein CcmH